MNICRPSKNALLAAAAAALLAALPVPGGCAAAKEAEVKAAFIYNFTRFVDWEAPPAPAGTFDICVLGEDPVSRALRALPETMVRKSRTLVRALGAEEAGIVSCRILYIARSRHGRAAAVTRALRGAGVLTVSDQPGFAEAGGVIGFYTENNRVKLEINVLAAREAGLRVDPRLLELSRVVGDKPAEAAEKTAAENKNAKP